MNTDKAPRGFTTRRTNGSLIPDHDLEHAVLAPNPNPSMGLTDASLGDLIVQALVHGVILGPNYDLPDDWQLLDNAFIETIATELKVLAIAASNGTTPLESGEPETLELTEEDVTRMLMTLHRRAEAAAELLKRLRSARVDHPSFGGRGEEDDPKAKTEEPLP